jgi:hypothetical protein
VIRVRDGDIQFRIAEARDDPAIRQLLRECAMSGRIGISLQREPSFFQAGSIEGPDHHAVIATSNGQIIALGSLSVRHRFINGKPLCVGYLGSLRLHPSHAGRFDILRRGYGFLRELQQKLNVPIYLTSIAADNRRAIALLERGLPGMPRYEHAGNLVTLLLRTRRRRRATPVGELDLDRTDSLLAHVNESMSRFQFAPLWTRDELDRILQAQIQRGNLLGIMDSGRIAGSASLWDQRSIKQTIITAYPRHLAIVRPLWNLVAPIFRTLPLPPVGKAISQAFVAHLAVSDSRSNATIALIDALAGRAYDAGIEILAIGLDSRDPRLAAIRRAFATRAYATRLYTVRWPDDPMSEPLDERLIYPEVALL